MFKSFRSKTRERADHSQQENDKNCLRGKGSFFRSGAIHRSSEKIKIETNKLSRNIKNEEQTRKTVRENPDPFQFFQVNHDPCLHLTARVIRGRNISKGRWRDLFDVPDPYITIKIRAAPDGRKSTRSIDNDPNPEWDESLMFLLSPDKDADLTAQIILMDANYTCDKMMASVEFDINSLPLNEATLKTFYFDTSGEVDIEFRKETKYDSDLRYSLALCNEEKVFRTLRKRKVFQSMRNLFEKHERLGKPRTLRDTPVIAVLGSGGGFRAMTGYAGAMKALHDSGVLDCCTYVAGLSGSSWYLSCLYANEEFPENGVEATNQEMRRNIATSPFWLLRPEYLMRYSNRLRVKMKSGQPVTFTDFFGLLIGKTLLGCQKMQEAKLSDFQEKVAYGDAPLPIMTCVHVRPRTSAMTFHDWVEFSPYEIGIAKYGSFLKTEHFGSKFFMGVISKQFEESPLHFLMGLWGSAFSILFNRIAQKGKEILNCETNHSSMRDEMEQRIMDDTLDECEDDSDSDIDSDIDSDSDSDYVDTLEDPCYVKEPEPAKQPGLISSWFGWNNNLEECQKVSEQPKPSKSRGFISSLVGSVFGTELLESREYRAAKVLNYMRGVSLGRSSYPISPFTRCDVKHNTIAEEGEFNQILEPIEVKKKQVHMVDAGLTFNSPYPPLLRPQRGVDIILSFDFSGRPSESSEPFKELLLAEKWARLHHVPFPKIDRCIFHREGMKECYVFRDEEDERAPIILHFVLCNIHFRKFSKPGIPREIGDHSGNFDIFDAPKTPYSTFNFHYTNEDFDKLHDLAEFNTLLNMDTILEQIANAVTLRQKSKVRGSITLDDIRKSVHLSPRSKEYLKVNLMRHGGSVHVH